MIKFDLPRLTMLLFRCQSIQDQYEQRVREGKGSQRLVEAEIVMVGQLIRDVAKYGEDVGFQDTLAQAHIFEMGTAKRPDIYDSSAIASEVRHLGSQIIKDVFRYKFVQIPEEVTKYVEQTLPFGQEVNDSFPSAAADLIAAGNCLAVECNTATAFHLMRAAEVALWELGKDRQIPLAKSGKIEFAEWGTIIGELEEAVRLVQQWPNSSTKEDAHKFYNKAVVEIRAFNDGWRRHSAHARPHMPKMESDEAIALWGHVFRFMQTLASKIGEGKYTPLVWI
jgi:hypothetical protein